MELPNTYHAFISYAHEDRKVARWLHQAIETYSLPPTITVVNHLSAGHANHPFYPCFLDQDELRSGTLSEQILQALASSSNLIVVCSLDSMNNKWVDAEVVEFLRTHPTDRVFPVIDGFTGEIAEVELFPPSLLIFTQN